MPNSLGSMIGFRDSRPGFGRRVLALLIDYALILGYVAVIGLISLLGFLITGGLFNWLLLGTAGAEALGFVVLVVPVGVYLFLTEASRWQATVGKRVAGLRVVAAKTGLRPSRGRILVRTVVKVLPWEFAHFFVWQTVASVAATNTVPGWVAGGLVVANVLPVLYVLVVLLQRERRGPHDLVAGTRVIR
jgi:uncharacterized RDD family membrane protein YckC